MDDGKRLAEFLAGLGYGDLPASVVESAKDAVLDQLGVQLATSLKPWSLVVLKYVRTLGGQSESTITTYGDRVKAEHAAFANATFGHGFEIDDTYLPSAAHPGCVAVSSALALGERELIDGKRFLLAVVAGYEAMGRVGRSVAPSYVRRGFHPTGAVGPFGAAAVAGKVLGFDSNLMLNALSIAASHCSGLHESTQTGGSVKRAHAGMAASGGIRAALLAQAGLTGPPTALEGKKGFGHAFSNQYDTDKLLAGLGKEFIVAETSYKFYACGHLIHSALQLTSRMVKQYSIGPDDIEEMVVGTNKNTLTVVGTIREPEDVTQSQFSTAFSLAMCVVKGDNSFRAYNEDNLRDPEIRKLAKRVKLELDDEVEATFPANRAVKITLKLKDGKTYREKLDWLKGTPENPATRPELQDKFRNLATLVLPDRRVEEIIKLVEGLDDLSDVSILARRLVR